MKSLTRSRAAALKAEAETSAELKGLKKSAPSSCAPSSISPLRHSDPKGPHNKENCYHTPCPEDLLSDDEALLSSSGFTEDSGYLSLHTSQHEHCDGDTCGPETLERCPQDEERRLSPGGSESKSRCLPVLRFQEEVCKQLTKGYRRNQSYDWTVVDQVAEDFGLHNIIGVKMGLGHVDILCDLLKKDMKHVLTRILGLLGECDLIK